MKMNISKTAVAVVALMTAVGVARATLYTPSWTVNSDVPDGSYIGLASSQSISDIPTTIGGQSATILDISVNLDISGGYNGDLYGYLVFQPTGGGAASMDVLLNQIGTSAGNPFGSSGAGFNNITLSDSGASSIHGATGVPTGTWKPDDGGQTLDATFGGQQADGTWTLFLADLSSGGGTSELVSWGLNISVVPEPVTWALIIFGAVLLGFAAVRRFKAARSV
jgi:subtilisin-like proprotein convertase family protein